MLVKRLAPIAAAFVLGALFAGLYGAGLRRAMWAELLELRDERTQVLHLAEAAEHVGRACLEVHRGRAGGGGFDPGRARAQRR